MARVRMYSVPDATAEALGLSEYRKHDGEGHTLLSARDLSAYGVERAVAEGAMEITAEEAKEKFNQ